jgi:hypothetical protein
VIGNLANVDRLDLSRFALVFGLRKSTTYDFWIVHWFDSMEYGYLCTKRLWKGIDIYIYITFGCYQLWLDYGSLF